MELFDFETVLNFGQHKGETVAEAMQNNPTYIEWCYANIDDFFITDAVWEVLDVHKNLEDALGSNGINPNEVSKAIAQNKKFHEGKRNKYKIEMIKQYELSLERCLEGKTKA